MIRAYKLIPTSLSTFTVGDLEETAGVPGENDFEKTFNDFVR